jgi:tetratricopeptide (TPR) repeat protein
VAGLALGQVSCDTLRARARAQKGVEKYRDGDIKGAADLFRQAADIDPTVPPIILNRGFTHLQLYQQNPRSKEGAEAAELAIKSFKQYMEMPDLKPEQRQRARDYLLQTFVDARRYDDAVQFFDKQVNRENPDLEALTILGNIAKSVGKNDDARKWLVRRVQANPKDTDGFVALAITNWDELCADSQCRTPLEGRKGHLSKSPEWRFQKANEGIDFLKKAIALSPQAPTPVIYANLLLRERSYAAANDDFKRAELNQATSLVRLALAMQKAATGAAAAPTPAANPDGGAPPDPEIKVWQTSQSVEAVNAIDTKLPAACPPPPPPPDPKAKKSKKPPEPPPALTAPCVPASYPGMALPDGTVPPVPGTAPGATLPGAAPAAPAAVPAPAPAPAPAAPAAAPVQKPAVPPPPPAPAAAPAPKPAPAPAAPAPKPAKSEPKSKAPAAAAPAPAAAPAAPPPPSPPRPAAPAPADDDEQPAEE